MTTDRHASHRHPDEMRWAQESARRNMERKMRESVERDHAAAVRENSVRDQAASMGVDFEAFMAADD